MVPRSSGHVEQPSHLTLLTPPARFLRLPDATQAAFPWAFASSTNDPVNSSFIRAPGGQLAPLRSSGGMKQKKGPGTEVRQLAPESFYPLLLSALAYW
jgi:hypothetical protein